MTLGPIHDIAPGCLVLHSDPDLRSGEARVYSSQQIRIEYLVW